MTEWYQILDQAHTGHLWFKCNTALCDNRPFMITIEQFEDAQQVVGCDICGEDCINTDAPDWHKSRQANSLALLAQLEGRYILTKSSAYRPVESGFVKIFKPVLENRIITGVCPIEISLLQHCTRNELQQLLEQSIGQIEYERWYNDQLKEYERVAG